MFFSEEQTDLGGSQLEAMERERVHAQTIKVSPRIVLRSLLAMVAVLSLLSFIGQLLFSFVDSFPGKDFFVSVTFVDNEQSLPTLFSVAQILACAGLVALIAVIERRSGAPMARRWAVLGIMLLYLSVDESLSLHERLIDPVRNAFDLTGVLYYAWVVPGAVAVLLVAVYFASFVFALPSRVRWLVVLSGAMFVAGALGLELLATAYVVDETGLPPEDLLASRGFGYAPISAAEEALEMSAISVLIFAMLEYLRGRLDELRLVWPEPGSRVIQL